MLKCAVIGNGVIAREHNAAYEQLEREGFPLRMVACCDTRAENLKEIRSGIRTYSSVDKLLEQEELDFADICLPTFLHAQIALQCMDAGCHVLCEKPMAISAEQCVRMIETSRRTGRKLMIGQLLRFFKPVATVKGLIESGELGKVRSAFLSRCDGKPDRPDGWILKKEYSGGVILDLQIHDADTVQWLFGMPDSVSAAALKMDGNNIYDSSSVNFFYGDGKYMHAYADWSVNGNRHLSRMFRVNFENGYVFYDKDTNVFDMVTPDGNVRSLQSETMNHCIYNEIRYFADCIRFDRSIDLCSPVSTMQSVELCMGMLASAESGGEKTALTPCNRQMYNK